MQEEPEPSGPHHNHAPNEAAPAPAETHAPEPAQPAPPEKIFTPPATGEVITCSQSKITYTMGEQIGEGYFGIVYGCTDEWNNQLAVKVLKPIFPYEQVLKAAHEEIQKLFVVRHPFITYVYDAFEYRDTFYIITERCHFPLDVLFKLDWFNGSFWVLPIAHCLLQAIDLIHRAGFVHQDIHLGNVFATTAKDELTPEQFGATQFKLGDLGVAKLITEVDAAHTRGWMLPPEVINPAAYGKADHRIDIYHAGLLLLQLALNKQLQFTAEEIAAGKPRELALGLQPPLNVALEKALRRRVHLRTQDAKELWRDLNSPAPAAESSVEIASRLSPPPAPPSTEPSRDPDL